MMATDTQRPAVTIGFEARFCRSHAVDLTAGCSFGCLYCPFSSIAAKRHGVSRPTALDISSLDPLAAPKSLYLSPASDAFAPQAAKGTHALLARVLPSGANVGIVTKGIIPQNTLALLGRYRDRIEGVAIGVTSLDDRRNRLLEPGCPDARSRLDNVNRLAAHGLPTAVRIDPLFPALDDDSTALEAIAHEAARRGAHAITATYVFAWGPYLRRLRREPLLAEACALLVEKAPMEGGTAFSVSLERKLATYARLAELAAARALKFNTCGCKDLRVREAAPFSTSCRNTSFLAQRHDCPTMP
jgi:DNA repair photolyase